jgi:hypothetical protein
MKTTKKSATAKKAAIKFKLGPLQKKWLSLLDGGKVKQTTGQLCSIDEETGKKRYCCLGVAADLVLRRKMVCEDGVGSADGEDMSLAKYKKLGLRSEFGLLDSPDVVIPKDAHTEDDYTNPCLANLNDNGWSFKKIAKFIRKNPKAVFIKSC